MKFDKELEIACKAIKAAGKIILDNFEAEFSVIRKDVKELTTKIDLESQTMISEILKSEFPDYGLISEETREKEFSQGLNWVIDPLDGTHNYIAGLFNFGVSIALVSNNEFLLGVIYLPYFDTLIYSVKGGKSYCNGEKIFVSNNNDLSKSVVTYDNQFHLSEKSFINYQKVIDNSFTTRILGSAVFDIALVAMGKIDARIWNNTKLVDIASGIPIIQGAGGRISDYDNNELNLDLKQVIASNSLVHNQLINILK